MTAIRIPWPARIWTERGMISMPDSGLHVAEIGWSTSQFDQWWLGYVHAPFHHLGPPVDTYPYTVISTYSLHIQTSQLLLGSASVLTLWINCFILFLHLELSVKSPCLLDLLSRPWYLQTKKILLNLGMEG